MAENLVALAMEKFKEGMTEGERYILECVQDEQIADLGEKFNEDNDPANFEKWKPERKVRGEFLRWLITDKQARAFVPLKGIEIQGAWIQGGIDLESAKIEYAVMLIGCNITGSVNFRDAETRSISFKRSHMEGLLADGIKVNGDVSFENARCNGEVRLLGADISGQLDCEDAEFKNEKGKCFNADELKVGGAVFFRKAKAHGEVRLPGADIRGQLDCENAEFKNENGKCFNAANINVGSDIFFRKTKTYGEVFLIGADISGQFSCTDAEFKNDKGNCFSADRLTVGGDVSFRKAKAHGEVRLLGADISGQLSFTDAEFKNDNGACFIASKANVNDMFFMRFKTTVGLLDLSHMKVGELVDKVESWPDKGKLDLTGFVYDNLAGDAAKISVEDRIEWLRRSVAFSTQPYEQLAKVYRTMGREHDAREVLIAKQDDLMKQPELALYRKVWRWTLKLILGYGYEPIRAFILLALLLVIGAFCFCEADKYGIMQPSKERVYMAESYIETHELPEQYPLFNEWAYSIDTLVPFVDLHQEDYWLPNAKSTEGYWIRVYLWFRLNT